MTLLTVVNDVCAVVGVHQATGVIANAAADRTMFEMLALANEMATRIASDTRDWTSLRKTTPATGPGSLVGNGATEAFPLPTDYRRMLMTTNVWRSTNTITPMRFIPDTDEWLQRRVANYAAPWGEWTIYGGQMHIWPIMAGPITGPPAVAAVTARFTYLDKNSVRQFDGSGIEYLTPGEVFQSDKDTFRLPERLLKLGMIWQWKANKGSPYAEDMGTFEDAMATAMGADSPAPIMIGRKTISGAMTSTSYPFEVPDGMVPR